MIIVHVNTHAYKSPYLKYLTINTCKRTFRDIGCQAIYFNKIIHEKSSSRLTVRRVTRHAKYARSLTLIHLYMHIVQTGMHTHTHTVSFFLSHTNSQRNMLGEMASSTGLWKYSFAIIFFSTKSQERLSEGIVWSYTRALNKRYIIYFMHV